MDCFGLHCKQSVWRTEGRVPTGYSKGQKHSKYQYQSDLFKACKYNQTFMIQYIKLYIFDAEGKAAPQAKMETRSQVVQAPRPRYQADAGTVAMVFMRATLSCSCAKVFRSCWLTT